MTTFKMTSLLVTVERQGQSWVIDAFSLPEDTAWFICNSKILPNARFSVDIL